MPTKFEIIANEWVARAQDLAQWTFEHMVNRTDVWGSYVSKERRRATETGRANIFFTAPFPAARGKVFLTPATLRKHFIAHDEGDLISLHSTSADKTSRWLAVDIDRHNDDDSVSPECNFAAALAWFNKLAAQGFDPLLFDTNGAGGYHVLIIFAEPLPTAEVFAFGMQLVSDWEKRGLAREPETYPKQACIEEGHFGNCLRLFGRHHTREVYSRVWSGEPEIDAWLEGRSAVDRILQTIPAAVSLIPKGLQLPERKKPKQPAATSRRQRVCVDLDGVLAAYDGWKGLDFMGAPIPGAVDFTRRLSEFADVIVFSSRCCVELHREELNEPTRPPSDLAPRLQHSLRYWLEKHRFSFKDIYIGQGKPAASAYIDDRAVNCSPQFIPDAFARALTSAKLLCTEGPQSARPTDDARLRALIEAWPSLTEKQKTKITKIK